MATPLATFVRRFQPLIDLLLQLPLKRRRLAQCIVLSSQWIDAWRGRFACAEHARQQHRAEHSAYFSHRYYLKCNLLTMRRCSTVSPGSKLGSTTLSASAELRIAFMLASA